MLRFLCSLVLVVYGCFALAVQHYEPTSWVVGVLVRRKLNRLHDFFPPALFPPQPAGVGGYALATGLVVAGVLSLKRLARL